MPVQKTELTTKIEQLKALEAQALKLQTEIVDQRPTELAGLYAAYGFATVAEFIKAVKEAADKAPAKKAGRPAKKAAKGKPAKAAKAAKKAGKPGRPKKAAPAAAKKEKKPRGRARITDEVKAKVRTLVSEGKSGSQIAKLLGISLPSVQNIKKDSGLVKARGPRKAKAAAPVAAAPAAVEAPAAAAPADHSAN
jgi:hypothetical protein